MLDLDQPLHDQIEAARKNADVTVPDDVRAYYAGHQDSMSTPDQRQALGDRAMRDPQENILARCVDALAGRLLFRRFLCEDESVQDWLSEFAIKNHMGNEVVVNTVSCLVDGNNALSLSWETDERQGGRVVIHQEPWWDGEEGMYAEVDKEGVTQWAVKEWKQADGFERRTVYLPDKIMRFIRIANAWTLYPDDPSGEQAWTKRDGTPLGVSVIHFGNAVTAKRVYGVSAVAPLLALQDALNGTIFDLVAAGALNAIPVYTATGVDTKGESFTIGPGRIWKTAASDASFGQLPGGSMDALLDTYRTTKSAIANQFPVSEHLVTGGDWPSGLALQKVESPMISRLKLLGDVFAPRFVMVAHRSVEIANAFGDERLNEDALVRVEYAPAEQLDEGTTTEIDREKVALYRDLMNLPKVLMLKTGLVTETEADAIIAERQATQLAMLGAFDSGAFGQQDYGAGSGSN